MLRFRFEDPSFEPSHRRRSECLANGLEREVSVLRYVSLLRASSSVGLVFDAWTIRSGIDAGILELVLLGLQDSWQKGKSGA